MYVHIYVYTHMCAHIVYRCEIHYIVSYSIIFMNIVLPLPHPLPSPPPLRSPPFLPSPHPSYPSVKSSSRQQVGHAAAVSRFELDPSCCCHPAHCIDYLCPPPSPSLQAHVGSVFRFERFPTLSPGASSAGAAGMDRWPRFAALCAASSVAAPLAFPAC